MSLWVADGDEGEDSHRYTTEHWFGELPEIETVAALFEEAKNHFAVLYPAAEATSFSVNMSRLRASDYRPPQAQHIHLQSD